MPRVRRENLPRALFADDLAKPIEVPLTINVTVITREMTAADADLFDPDDDN